MMRRSWEESSRVRSSDYIDWLGSRHAGSHLFGLRAANLAYEGFIQLGADTKGYEPR